VYLLSKTTCPPILLHFLLHSFYYCSEQHTFPISQHGQEHINWHDFSHLVLILISKKRRPPVCQSYYKTYISFTINVLQCYHALLVLVSLLISYSPLPTTLHSFGLSHSGAFSLNISSEVHHQGLCTCHFHYVEKAFPRYPCTWLPHSLHVSVWRYSNIIIIWSFLW
jgi:hypothetical protein